MENEFDYSLVDNETADFLRSCEYEINGITEDARIKVGGVLLKARDKLGNNKNGVFQKWLASGRISKDDAYYYINLNISSRNLDNIKLDNFLNAPKTLQKEVMKKNAPEELKQKVYDGDITTNKQYQDEIKAREEAEKRAQQIEQQAESERKERERLEEENEELTNRKPREITKVKEVIPDHLNEEIEQLERVVESQRIAFDEAKRELESYRLRDANSYDEEEARKEIQKLNDEADKSVLRFKIKVDRFIEEVAITSFMEGAIASCSDPTRKKLQDSVDYLKSFTKKMESTLKGRVEI